jgi:YD repeat-containing protein
MRGKVKKLVSPPHISTSYQMGRRTRRNFHLKRHSFCAATRRFNTLVKNVDDTFTLTRRDQTQFLFSAGGALTSIRDKNGNTVGLTYGLGGNFTQITDTVGRNHILRL